MKSRIATLMAAVLVLAQPANAQIGVEIDRVQVPVRAQPSPTQQTQQTVHVVRRGDTLWDLSNQYLGNPFFWPTIHEANLEVVEDPHWIYPEERLVIPGAPTAVAEGPPGNAGLIRQIAGERPGDPARRTRFYRTASADPTVISAEDLRQAGVQPGEHYSAPWLVAGEIEAVGTVLRAVDSPESNFEADLMVHPFDEIYIEYTGATRPLPGVRLMIATPQRRLAGDGRQVMRPAGIVTVVAEEPDVMRVRVSEQWGEIRRGALAMPLVPFPPVEGGAEPLANGPRGEIIGWEREQSLYGPTDMGFIDIGSAQDVRVGDVLLAYRPSRTVSGATVPSEPVGFAKVVRVEENSATFRLTRVMQRRLDTGMPVQVVSRVP